MMRCVAAAALAFAALSGAACQQTRAGQDALPPPSGAGLPPPAVPTLAPPASASAGVSATDPGDGSYRGTGTLRARERAELAPKMSGVITAIAVKEGERVKKGQRLFQVDAAQAALGVAQARAALESAEVALASAELDLKRTKELFDRNSVAPATYDQAKTRHESAKVGVAQAKVALSQAQRSAGDTSVYAPFDGVVTQKLKSVGEMATMMPPSVVLIVQDVDVVELRSNMPERVLREIGPGDRVEVAFPGIDQKRLVPITRVNPTIDVRTRTVEVVAEIPNPDGALKPGMLAEVRLVPKSEAPKADAAAPASTSRAR